MKRYELYATNSIFLALRYTLDAIERAKREFEPRWPEGLLIKEAQRD